MPTTTSSLVALAALAAAALARTNVMVPLYVYPGNTTWTNPAWSAALAAVRANPGLHFYLVINPNSGPKNTSDPSGFNGGYCSVAADPNYIAHGCNRDWTTHLAALAALPNAQPLGYVYTNYGARPLADVQADVREWAQWDRAPTWSAGQPDVDIAMHGLWFDEVGAAPSNYSYLRDLVAYANESFAHLSDAGDDYTVVLNAGPVADPAYESQLFGLASAVVTKETCYTDDPDAAGVAWDCPAPYAPFDVAALSPGNGLPHDPAFLPQAVVIVHQFTGPPDATVQMLQDQINGVVDLGIHSTYFTSGSWHNTTIEPATIEQVGSILTVANGNGAGGGGGGLVAMTTATGWYCYAWAAWILLIWAVIL